MDEHTISPAGDPFYAASLGSRRNQQDQDTPHGCIDGVVYIGHMTEDPETGEQVEVFETVPCRRCAPAQHL